MSAQAFRVVRRGVGNSTDLGIQARTARMVRSELRLLARLMGASYEDAARRVGSVTTRGQETILRWAERGVPTADARGMIFDVFEDLEEHLRVVNRLTGANLRRLRERVRLSPGELGAMLDVSTSTYLAWEMGEQTPQSESLERLRLILIEGRRTDRIELTAAGIRWAREQRGWTMRELATALGTCHSAVSEWESGKTQISRRYARRIRALLEDPQVKSE